MPRDWQFDRYPGKYVAIDMTTDEVVLAADTPQELEAAIKEQARKNVATMRAPQPDEPLFAGGATDLTVPLSSTVTQRLAAGAQAPLAQRLVPRPHTDHPA